MSLPNQLYADRGAACFVPGYKPALARVVDDTCTPLSLSRIGNIIGAIAEHGNYDHAITDRAALDLASEKSGCIVADLAPV